MTAPTPYTVGETLWRVVEHVESRGYVDFDGEWRRSGESVHAYLDEWEVLRTTPKGAWVAPRYSSPWRDDAKWISLSPKRFSRTREGAKAKALRTRRYHIGHIERRLATARMRLSRIEAIDTTETP